MKKLIVLGLCLAACVPDRRPAEGADDVLLPAPAGHTPRSADKPIPERGAVLDRKSLIESVLARNPSIESRKHAWQSARAKRGTVDALDDPVIAYSIAPMSIGSSNIGQTVQLSQRFPWPGKLSSRGESADHQADAARQEIRVSELDLALEASELYDDYYLVERSLEVNAVHKSLLSELQASAEAQYSVGRAALQDPLQAEVERTRLDEQDAMLKSRRAVIVASLNALLHRAPDSPLASPPKTLKVRRDAPPSFRDLGARALSASPELRRERAKRQAASADATYAEREYYPDFTLMASYSTMFMPDHRFMVGVSTPIPIQRGKRGAALDESDARIAETRSESARIADRILADVEVSRQRVLEAREIVSIYEGRLIPAARDQVAAARSDFRRRAPAFPR